MMAEKARIFGDTVRENLILGSPSPQEQKRLGRHVNGFSDEVWVRQARRVVTRGNVAKFCQNEGLQTLLLSTKGTLVEASPYDSRWGIYAIYHGAFVIPVPHPNKGPTLASTSCV